MDNGLYSVGTQLYYPVHGVAELSSIDEKEIGEHKISIYTLTIVDSGLKIMVPTKNADTVGIRNLINADDIKEVYEILESKEGGSDSQTWNRRQREYMDKIKTGSAFEIAEVLRDLSLLRAKKTLSFGERKMLETAKSLLVREISVALEKAKDVVEEHINSFFIPKAA